MKTARIGILRWRLNALNDALEPDRSSRSLSTFITRHGLAYGLSLEAEIEIDAELFRDGLKTAARLEREDTDAAIDAYREAIDRYAGDYLPDALYEDWASLERERLQTLYLSGAMRLAALLVQQAGYQEAIHLCQSVLMIDRYWEEAYRLMMISHTLRGNRPLALRVYEQCQQALQEGLELQPMAATTELYQSIMRGDPLPQP